MMNLNTYLNRNSILILISLILIIGCGKEEKKIDEIVKVNDVSLTEEDLKRELNDYSNQGKLREEFIQQWIESEVLYQQAVEEGITNNSEFNSIKIRTEKQLANSILIKKILEENAQKFSTEELIKYYDDYSEDFRLEDDSYKLNIANFNNFENAVQFRSILIDSDWKRAVNTFKGDKSLVKEFPGVIYSAYNLPSVVLSRTAKNLQPGEVSVVLETEQNLFTIVQLVDKLYKGSIPPFNVIEHLVKERLLIVKQKEFVKNYIDKLIEDHNVEIKRYNE